MQQIIQSNALLLTAYAVLAAVLISSVSMFTSERITKERTIFQQQIIRSVIPVEMQSAMRLRTISLKLPASTYPLIQRSASGQIGVQCLYIHQTLIAYLFRAVVTGYAGDIHLMVAVQPTGNLYAVRVLEHRETPGLTDLLDDQYSDWIDSFIGDDIGALRQANVQQVQQLEPFDQLTGATITASALLRAFQSIGQLFKAQYPALQHAVNTEQSS